jgi:hypothetical protein
MIQHFIACGNRESTIRSMINADRPELNHQWLSFEVSGMSTLFLQSPGMPTGQAATSFDARGD